MSDEIKNKNAAETVAENMTAMSEAIAETSPTVEDVAATVEAVAGKKGKSQTAAKEKKQPKAEAKPKAGTGGTLKSVGLDACKRHGIAEVWVTADGQSFAQEGDAKAHAANLNDKQTLNVKAE